VPGSSGAAAHTTGVSQRSLALHASLPGATIHDGERSPSSSAHVTDRSPNVGDNVYHTSPAISSAIGSYGCTGLAASIGPQYSLWLMWAGYGRCTGRVKVTVVPTLHSLCNQMCPPWASTATRQKVSPRPLPTSPRVLPMSSCAHVSNTFSTHAFSLPRPWSATLKATMSAPYGVTRTRIVAPGGLNFMALLSRLTSIRSVTSGSPDTGTVSGAQWLVTCTACRCAQTETCRSDDATRPATWISLTWRAMCPLSRRAQSSKELTSVNIPSHDIVHTSITSRRVASMVSPARSWRVRRPVITVDRGARKSCTMHCPSVPLIFD
jgi:hypothetical protein